MSDFAEALRGLADPSAYPAIGHVSVRWGQLLREDAEIGQLLALARAHEALIPLQRLARVRSGVVTRANAYFIVRELSLDQIPSRFRVTRRDLQRIAVVTDGKHAPFKIERFNLRLVVKGPEALLTPTSIAQDDQRLFDVRLSKEELRKRHASGTLGYLHRGETVEYRVSEDSLKGGIPATRANIKSRRPFWYSLGVPEEAGLRIAVPEHHDKRYIATLIPPGSEAVVIDTCYVVQLSDQKCAEIVLASLNSLLTWYQLELRGRTQHGEGVLKVKIPDWQGILVLNPERLNAPSRRRLLSLWAPLSDKVPGPALGAVSATERVAFDRLVLQLCGTSDPEAMRLCVERELRAAVAERHTRAESVAEAKRDRTPARRTTASVDAYAARIATRVETFPDPREFVPDGAFTLPISVNRARGGAFAVGTDLFSFREVFSGDVRVASTPDQKSAEFVRGVLLQDPDATQIQVPLQPWLDEAISAWAAKCAAWQLRFAGAADETLGSVVDTRLREQIKARALVRLSAV